MPEGRETARSAFAVFLAVFVAADVSVVVVAVVVVVGDEDTAVARDTRYTATVDASFLNPVLVGSTSWRTLVCKFSSSRCPGPQTFGCHFIIASCVRESRTNCKTNCKTNRRRWREVDRAEHGNNACRSGRTVSWVLRQGASVFRRRGSPLKGAMPLDMLFKARPRRTLV